MKLHPVLIYNSLKQNRNVRHRILVTLGVFSCILPVIETITYLRNVEGNTERPGANPCPRSCYNPLEMKIRKSKTPDIGRNSTPGYIYMSTRFIITLFKCRNSVYYYKVFSETL